jgi:GMP synthase (glutamine-hydrolysing)
VRPVLVLQHVPWERPALVGRALDAVPLTTRTVVADREPDLPRVRDLAGLVVMGGPQEADDDAAWPGLPAERRLLAGAVADELPVLGVCLGMQLIATALGARLHRGHGTEIGFGDVDVLAPDPVLDHLGSRPMVLHWHSDAVELPAGATLLASTATTPVQAFRAGSALGLQFHVEVEPDLLAEWLDTPQMTAGLPATTTRLLRVDGARHLADLAPRASAGLAAFAASVRERA